LPGLRKGTSRVTGGRWKLVALMGYKRAVPSISVIRQDGSVYRVTVSDSRSETTHEVAVWPSDIARYAPDATPEELLEASFRFLLEREPKEAILTRFELPVIERYFPEYRRVIGNMIAP
jgi:hypothetical protein